jgi:hypothetical protein
MVISQSDTGEGIGSGVTVPYSGLLRYLQKLYFCFRTPAGGAPPEAPPEAKKKVGVFFL